MLLNEVNDFPGAENWRFTPRPFVAYSLAGSAGEWREARTGPTIATAHLNFSFVFIVLAPTTALPNGKNADFCDHFTQNRRETPVIA